MGKAQNIIGILEGRYSYVKQDGRSVTNDYNESGNWNLVDASKVCLHFAYSVMSPDASGQWLVMIIPGLSKG